MQQQTIKVVIRARPSTVPLETTMDKNSIQLDEENSSIIFMKDNNNNNKKGQNFEFKFSKVFNSKVNQTTVYNECNLINDVIEGINCCIITYGQTGSGKTYTMYGSGWEENSYNSSIVPINNNEEKIKTTNNVEVSGDNNNEVTCNSRDSPYLFMENNNNDNKISIDNNENNNNNNNNEYNSTNNINNESNNELLGIIPRSIADLFQILDEKTAQSNKFYYSVRK
jgi:hypothetical protein